MNAEQLPVEIVALSQRLSLLLPLLQDEWNITARSESCTLTAEDRIGTVMVDATTAAVVITLPTSPTGNRRRRIVKTDVSANIVTISGNGNLINGVSTFVLYNQYDTVLLEPDGTGWKLVGFWSSIFGGFMSLTDPGADRILFWDESSNTLAWLAVGNSIVITATTIDTVQDIRTTATPQFAKLGVGVAAASDTLVSLSGSVSGATTLYGILTTPTVQSGVTTLYGTFQSQPNTAVAAFTLSDLRHFIASGGGTIGAGSAITTQTGFHAAANLTGATNNYGFRGAIASGANRYNLYMDGTAVNYLAGNTGIGTVPVATSIVKLAGNQTGSVNMDGANLGPTVQSDVTGSWKGFVSSFNTQAAAFVLSDVRLFEAKQDTVGAGSTVTTVAGFVAASTLVGGTNTYGFHGAVTSGSGKYNLYMPGTAANYLAGFLGLGATPSATVQLLQGGSFTGGTTFYAHSLAGTIASDVTTLFVAVRSAPTLNGPNPITDLRHFQAVGTTISAGSITTQVGFYVGSDFTTGVTNIGLYSNIASSAFNYNVYAAGTAKNQFDGVTTINNTTDATSSSVAALVVIGGVGVGKKLVVAETSTLTGHVAIGSMPQSNVRLYLAGTYNASTSGYGVFNQVTAGSTVTNTWVAFDSNAQTDSEVFTLSNLIHFRANDVVEGAGSGVTTQTGFEVATSFDGGGTNNYGFRGRMAAAAGGYNLYMDGTAQNYLAGDMQFAKTVTAGGTTGAQTINKTTGSVNFAAAAASLVVTNNLVATSSIIIATVATNDATMTSVQAVAGAGSFTLYPNVAPTGETRVNFLVTN